MNENTHKCSLLLFAFIQKPALPLVYPALTSVASCPSPPPLQTFSGFDKTLDFYLRRCFDVVTLFCSVKSAQNKQKEWNMFCFISYVHLHARHYAKLVRKTSFTAMFLLVCCFSPLSHHLFLKYYLKIPTPFPTPTEHTPFLSREGKGCLFE